MCPGRNIFFPWELRPPNQHGPFIGTVIKNSVSGLLNIILREIHPVFIPRFLDPCIPAVGEITSYIGDWFKVLVGHYIILSSQPLLGDLVHGKTYEFHSYEPIATFLLL